MFFSSSNKAGDPPAGRDSASQTASPPKKPGAPTTTSCILSILIFNPTFCPEVATKGGEQGEEFNSETSAAVADDDANGYGLSREEQEQEAKIVYSYPPDREPEERRSQTGLLEGLLMFTKPFASREVPLRTISTDKYIIVVEEVEKDYWLAITFAANALPCFNATDPTQASCEVKRIDDDTQEDILLGVLRSIYATFRLLHGRIGLYQETGRRQELEDVLNDFCPAFLETIDSRKLSVFHTIAGYHFAPVDRLPYLSVPSLIALLQQNYPCIHHAALLLNGCLVYHSMNTPLDERRPVGPCERRLAYSGLEFEDDALIVLYSYLVSTEGSAAVDMHKLLKPPFGRVPTAAARPGGGCSSFGRAIMEDGPANFIFGTIGQFAYLPTIHMADDSTGSLLAVVHEQLLLVLILDGSDERISDVSFLQHVRSAAVEGPCGLRELNAVLSAEFKKIMRQEDTYRFIYFNHANHAIRISNRQCLVNSPSPPYFKNFCLSFQEVQRVGHMHCKFLGVAEPIAANADWTFGYPDSPCTSPTAGGTSRKVDAADSDENAPGIQPNKATSVASKDEGTNKQRGSGILEGVRIIAVKDAQSGWLVGKRTCDREHFLALDDPKTTFTKAMEDASRFSSLHFSNIFV